MENPVHAHLMVELPLLLADAFKIPNHRMDNFRQARAYVGEHAYGKTAVSDWKPPSACLFEIWPELVVVKPGQLVAYVLFHLNRRDHNAAGIACGRGYGRFIHCDSRYFGDLHVGFIKKLAAYTGNLGIDRLEWHLLRHHLRHVLLQHSAKNPAEDHESEDEHHPPSQSSFAEAKSGVKQNDGIADESEPKMAAHPS